MKWAKKKHDTKDNGEVLTKIPKKDEVCGNFRQRRTRKWQTPHAEMAIPACGDGHGRTRGF